MDYSRSPKASPSDRGASYAIEGFLGRCGDFYFGIASGWAFVGLPKEYKCVGGPFC